MKRIGGNTQATFQIKETARNEIGELIETWTDSLTVMGWLDLMSGTSSYQKYSTKLESATHIFMCDYCDFSPIIAENSRCIINGQRYAVKYIDDPMGMHQHMEIYLEHTGGQQ